jgi:hypothetical protein
MAVWSLRGKKLMTGAATIVLLAALVVASTVSSSDAGESPSRADVFSVLQPLAAEGLSSLPAGGEDAFGYAGEFGAPAGLPSEAGTAETPSGDEVLVTGAAARICVQNLATGLSNCADSDLAAAGQVYSAAPDFEASPQGCGAWQIIGLMPDGVESLNVVAEGAEEPANIPVVDNVYTATVAPVRTILSSGSISVEIPLDQFASGNTAC